MSKEAMKLALEALKDERDKYLEYSTEDGAPEYIYKAIRALEFEVAKQEQVCRDDGRCQYAIDSGAEGMGHCPKGKCVMPAKQEQGEPLEYWNAVEGWVKLDEVREHFDSVSCATIYKNGGEGRVPLSLAQPKQEQGESEPDQFINAMKFDLVVQQHLDALRQAGRATMETVKDKLAETLYKEYGGK